MYFNHKLTAIGIKDSCVIIYGYEISTKSILIYSFFTSKEARGNGYGRKLLKHCIEDYNRTNGKYKLQLKVFKQNTKAIELYKRYKFKIKKELKGKDMYLMEYDDK